MATDKQLHKLYYNTKCPGAYGGSEKLYRSAREHGLIVTRKHVENFLRNQLSYTLHKPARHKFVRNKTYVKGIDSQWQADLADMHSLARGNKGYCFLLTCIDIFSKFAWVEPVKNKTAVEVTKAFANILKRAHPRQPIKLQTDKGKEFFNRPFASLMRDKAIEHFASESDQKAAVVERFNRTIKTRIWNYFTAHATTRYIDDLQNHVGAYNAASHRTIGMAPKDVTGNDEVRLWKGMFLDSGGKKVSSKSSIPTKQMVRISKWKGEFDKGYVPNWSREHFNTVAEQKHPQTVYKIVDKSGEPVKGVFYRKELQPISSNEYEVERIIKRRKIANGKTELLVKWKGWPSSFNRWILASHIDSNKRYRDDSQ